eukprot:9498391-Pyramimonas_sp.AAC.3
MAPFSSPLNPGVPGVTCPSFSGPSFPLVDFTHSKQCRNIFRQRHSRATFFPPSPEVELEEASAGSPLARRPRRENEIVPSPREHRGPCVLGSGVQARRNKATPP